MANTKIKTIKNSTQSEAPAETQSEAPAETQSEAPSETQSEAPAETQSEAPSETQSEAELENRMGFKMLLTISNIDSIKPRKADSFKTKDGEKIDYGYAVKFKTRNIETVVDEEWGEKDIETTLEVEIPCDRMADTIALNKFMKNLKDEKKEFILDTTMPNINNGIYSVKSNVYGADFIKNFPKK